MEFTTLWTERTCSSSQRNNFNAKSEPHEKLLPAKLHHLSLGEASDDSCNSRDQGKHCEEVTDEDCFCEIRMSGQVSQSKVNTHTTKGKLDDDGNVSRSPIAAIAATIHDLQRLLGTKRETPLLSLNIQIEFKRGPMVLWIENQIVLTHDDVVAHCLGTLPVKTMCVEVRCKSRSTGLNRVEY